MATLYWKGAISSNVQTAGNWSLTRPGIGTNIPPSASLGPQDGDSVIFADMTNTGWNPIFAPAGLIGNGLTASILNNFIVENKFLHNVGTNISPVQAYVTNSFSLKKGINQIPATVQLPTLGTPSQDGKVFIVSLNEAANLQISAQSNMPFSIYTTNYYISGELNSLRFVDVYGASRMKVYLGSHSGNYAENINYNTNIGISGGIITDNNTRDWKLFFGKKANIGGQNILLGDVTGGKNYITIERGVSLENLHLVHSSYAIGNAYSIDFREWGATYGETGPQGPKTYIKNFKLEGLPYFSGYSQDPLKCDFWAGVCFDNMRIEGVTDVNVVFDPLGAINSCFVKNMDFYISPNKMPSPFQDLYWPKLTVNDTERFAVGAANEVGGANIVFPVGFSYDVPASIFLNGQGTYILDIV